MAIILETQDACGFDTGKLIKGRKCHLLVDTVGLVLVVVVHGADIQDRDGAYLVFTKLREHFSWLKRVWADAGYTGPKLGDWVRSIFTWVLEIVKRTDDLHRFEVQPKRWIVERTLGWLNRSRRLSKDDERLTDSRDTGEGYLARKVDPIESHRRGAAEWVKPEPRM
jgi:putative transposase